MLSKSEHFPLLGKILYAFEAAHPGVIFLGKKHISFDHLTKCETILETFEIDYSK